MGCTVYVAKTKALITCAINFRASLFWHMQNADFLVTRLISYQTGNLALRFSCDEAH